MITLTIKGMTCNNCVKHVQHAIQAVPGVTSVEIDLASGRAEVQGSADPGILIAAVVEEGYETKIQA